MKPLFDPRAAFLIAALSLVGAVARADDTTPPKSPPTTGAAARAKADPDRVICRTEEVMGSLTRRKQVCHTKREWDQIAYDTKRMLDDTTIMSSQPH